MYFKSAFILVILSYISLVQSNDIRLEYSASQSPHSRIIYSEIAEASPAIWRRKDNIVIDAPDHEVISAIYVTDLRENKDGEALIESGGVGWKSVVIELKSPSILRGYKFKVEVFADDLSQKFQSKGYSSPIYDEYTKYARKF